MKSRRRTTYWRQTELEPGRDFLPEARREPVSKILTRPIFLNILIPDEPDRKRIWYPKINCKWQSGISIMRIQKSPFHNKFQNSTSDSFLADICALRAVRINLQRANKRNHTRKLYSPPGSTLHGYLSKISARSCQDLGKILAKIVTRYCQELQDAIVRSYQDSHVSKKSLTKKPNMARKILIRSSIWQEKSN